MTLDKNALTFLELVRAGLWEKEARLEQYGKVDFEELYRLAGEQSVVGLVTAGFDHIKDVKAPQEIVLQCIGESLQIEQTNKEMNLFIEDVVGSFKTANVYSLLLKGQGVAQSYEKPMWRPSGDIDFFLDKENYEKAINLLLPMATSSKFGGAYSKEFAIYTEQWMIELHGTMRTCLSSKLDKEIDAVQKDVFTHKKNRTWRNGDTDVLLPAPDEDVFIVFTHFIKHFYKEGMNLRQICDWCRLLWTYKDSLNHELLESRIRKTGLMSEWKAFAALAVEYLGMPVEAMPLYAVRGKKKAEQILKHILKGLPYNVIRDTWSIAKIFPWNTIKFSPAIFLNVNGLKIKERLFN